MKKLLWFIVFAGSNLLAMEGGESTQPEVTKESEIIEVSEEEIIGGLPLEYFKTLPSFILESEILPKLSRKERGRLLKALGHEYIGQLEEEKEKHLAEQQLMNIIGSWNEAYKTATGLLESMKEVDGKTGFQILQRLIQGALDLTINAGARLTEAELEELQKIVSLLISKGASVKQNREDLLTNFIRVLAFYPSDWPEEREIAQRIAQQLIDAGIDVNVADQNGITPLMVAAAHANRDMVQMLLDAGVDTTFVNTAKKMAIDFAKTDEIKQMILEKQKEQEAKKTEAEGKEEE